MPILWMPVSMAETTALRAPAVVQHAASDAALVAQHGHTAPPASAGQQLDEELVVRAKVSVYDPLTETFVFEQGVVATYGVTTVRADRLEVHMAEGEEWGHATGSVRVDDPEAEITADELRFTWKRGAQSGTAKNVAIRIGHAHIKAETAQLDQELWDFRNVEASNCPEYYWIRSPRVTVTPESSGKIENPTLYAFGRRLITLPDRSFNLNPRTQGVSLPSVSFRRRQGIGVSWEAGWLLNPQTNLYVSMGVFPKSYPSLSVVATRSNLPADRGSTILTPASDLGERFRFGYLENIEVQSPEQEQRFLRTERNSISLGTSWNQGTSGRNFDTFVSKAIEGIYEIGGTAGARRVTRKDDSGKDVETVEGGIGYLAQARVQTIRERGNPWTTRALLQGSAALPTFKLSPQVGTIARLDTTQFVTSQPYGWFRGTTGLYYEPIPQLRLSGAAVGAVEYGTPQFAFDGLQATNGFHARIDLNLGPTKISYLQKYDTRFKFYDREYTISQVAGCIEPYLLYRQFPSDYRIGVRLRLDDFYEILQRRQLQRGNRTTQLSP